ncbi:pyridoxal-dependent decarboxylase [Kitasatospora sp. NBC_00240]|uniref:pyridoxal phosphate-dependent decarboxylase family protein n=1 Tax=Kitasatospora sp. NBC_00240 TaxID=2903567 RepID=UPI00224DA1C4|nr:pyridoxal-dependent decarboxylase [Kitasatospora sp. NBC_00240]MCX5211851.1 pyridoxal-dependent decarboxylase [Kitasatospora sp. NBC_00240]
MTTPLVLDQPPRHLTAEHREELRGLFTRLIDLGLDFKLQDSVFQARRQPFELRDTLLVPLPEEGSPIEAVLDEFVRDVLPDCKNENSPFFLGFGDTGDDVAALCGGLLSLFTQQNLINQSFDSPSGTFVEIAVLRWLRGLLGYRNSAVERTESIWDVGGCVTHGGTLSNTIAMMLAREHRAPGTMEHGITDPSKLSIVVPRGIGHYSVKSAMAWIGCGSRLVEVDTIDFRYDLRALERTLRKEAGSVMAVVAYAGDSRTHTIENLSGVHDLVRSVDESIWLHADACWGLACALTDKLSHKIDGIGGFDSITVDPHKVMGIPYALSALLVRDPAHMRMVASYSDLIMQEDFAIGQTTPFIGSKAWMSLKLWMMVKAYGRSGLAAMVERRLETTRRFTELVDASPRLVRLNDPDLTAVAFMYVPADVDLAAPDVDRINKVNQAIHDRMLAEGTWHLHQFSLPDKGTFYRGATLYPLRFMGQNLRIEEHHLTGVLDHVTALGRDCE